MPSAIETFLPILGVGNQGQQQLVVYLGSLLGSPCQQLRSVLLMSGVGVSVRWSSWRSFPGVSKLQLPPSDFQPSVSPPPHCLHWYHWYGSSVLPSPLRSADASCWLKIVPEIHRKTSSNACVWQKASKSSHGFLSSHPQSLLCFLVLSDLGVKGARTHKISSIS